MNSLCRILWSIPTRNRNVSVWFESSGGGEGRVGEGGRDIFFVPCQQFRFSYSLNSCDSLVNVHTGCSLRSCLKITAFFGTKQNKQLRSICCFRLIMSLLLKKTTCKYNLMHRMNWNSWNHSSFEWHNVNLCPILPPPPRLPFRYWQFGAWSSMNLERKGHEINMSGEAELREKVCVRHPRRYRT